MKKIWLVFFIFYLTICSCSIIRNYDFPNYKKNIILVKNIIKNYDHLDIYLNDTNLCEATILKYSFKSRMEDLRAHIDSNKFYEGYKFEIADDLAYGSFGSEPPSFLVHHIKIRSNFNKDIIWFAFSVKIGEKKWKLNSFDFCNNSSQRVWGDVDVPCDKE